MKKVKRLDRVKEVGTEGQMKRHARVGGLLFIESICGYCAITVGLV